MVNQEDLRVIRSKKMITDAFIELIEEKGYENITIKDIAERAMVNRKTFYSHYESKAVLFGEIVKETLELLMKDSQHEKLDLDNAILSINLDREIQIMLRNITDNKRLFKIMFGDISSYELRAQIEKLLQTKISNRIVKVTSLKGSSDIPREILTNSITAILMVVVKWWISQENYSEEDAAEIFQKLISTGFTQLIGIH